MIERTQWATTGVDLHLERGVWTAPYLDRTGCEILQVMLSHGVRLAEIRIPHGAEKAVIVRHAEAILEALEPPSRSPLSLLRRDD